MGQPGLQSTEMQQICVTRLSSSRDSLTPLTDSLIEKLSHLKTQVMLVSYLSHNTELGFNVQIYSLDKNNLIH